MQLTAPVHWGIAGCGWVARDYVAPAMAAASTVRLTAVCDPDPAALSRIASEAPEIARHATLADFLATPGLEAVYVATPNHLHRPIVEAAARAGKHVLCEKPMATSLADAEAMVAACRGNGVRYATAFDQRFQARHRRLRELVREGRLGEITAVRVHYACWTPADWSPPTTQGTHDNWRIDPARAGGGAFIDLAPHGLDLAQVLLGEPLVETRGLLQRRVFDYPVDDGAVLVGRFRSGALLLLNVAYNCPDHFPRRTLELIGTRAMAIAQDTMGQTPGGTLRLVDAASGTTETVAVTAAEDVSPFAAGIEAFSPLPAFGRAFPVPARTRSPHHAFARRREAGLIQRRPSRHVPLRLYELRLLAAQFCGAHELSRVPGFSAHSGGKRFRVLELGGSGPEDRDRLARGRKRRGDLSQRACPRHRASRLPHPPARRQPAFRESRLVFRRGPGRHRGPWRRALAGGVAPPRLRRFVAGASTLPAGGRRHSTGGLAVDQRFPSQLSVRRIVGTRAGRRTPPHRRSFRRARRPLSAGAADVVRGRHGQVPPLGKPARHFHPQGFQPAHPHEPRGNQPLSRRGCAAGVRRNLHHVRACPRRCRNPGRRAEPFPEAVVRRAFLRPGDAGFRAGDREPFEHRRARKPRRRRPGSLPRRVRSGVGGRRPVF